MFSFLLKSLNQFKSVAIDSSPNRLFTFLKSIVDTFNSRRTIFQVGDYARLIKADSDVYQCDHRFCLKVIGLHTSDKYQHTLVFCAWTDWNGKELVRRTNWFPSDWLAKVD